MLHNQCMTSLQAFSRSLKMIQHLIYNHGFLLGNTSDISFETQGILDERLEIVQESGQGHGGH